MAIAPRQHGFSLIETIVGMAIVLSAGGVLAHLAFMSTRATRSGLAQTQATAMAVEAAERLAAELRVGGAGALALSPPQALTTNTAGFFDSFDARGATLGGGPGVPAGAAYVRRWSVEPVSGGPADARLVRVVVVPWPQADGLSVAGARRVELVRLVVVWSRP